MKFEIKNRFSGTVQLAAEIDCAEGADASLKIGLAVEWGIQNGANLLGANLLGANLGGAKNIVRVGPSSDGYEFFGVVRDGEVWICAGCRWFSASDARAHWIKTRGDTALGNQRLAFVDFIEATMMAREDVA